MQVKVKFSHKYSLKFFILFPNKQKNYVKLNNNIINNTNNQLRKGPIT